MSRALPRSTRPRVLLAWELGDGLGHVGRLLPLAQRLAEDGFEPVFALRDPIVAGARAAALGHLVLQAPITKPRRAAPGFYARSYADILALLGFEDEALLGGVVRTWRCLLDLVDPVLAIGDFSPGLALATVGARVKLLQVGSGFALPPLRLARFPVINPAGTAIAEPARLARAIGAVLPRGTVCGEDDLPRLFGGERQVACTWPLLDPYRTWRSPAALGPMAATSAARVDRRRAGWFAYLAADAPRSPAILEGLLQSRLPGSAFVRGADAALAARFAGAGHRLYAVLPSLAVALEDAAVVVHHGGINTAEMALALGVPQLVLSRHLEQHLTGAAIEAAGAGRLLRGDLSPARVTEALQDLVESGAATEAAQRCAAALSDRTGALESVVTAVHELMSRPVAGAA